VLRAIGLDDDRAHASLRFTVGRFTTTEDVDHAAARVVEVVQKLRSLSSARTGAN
jgi:cysteine desulfurase